LTDDAFLECIFQYVAATSAGFVGLLIAPFEPNMLAFGHSIKNEFESLKQSNPEPFSGFRIVDSCRVQTVRQLQQVTIRFHIMPNAQKILDDQLQILSKIMCAGVRRPFDGRQVFLPADISAQFSV
jgi:hypothetical protein